MGWYFNPPPPVQATIHAPIPAQGQQPPPYRPIAALMVAASLAWTPTPVPAQATREIASLIPPPVVSQPTPSSRTVAASIRAIWDQQPAWNAQRAQPVAPLTLIYGQQPPPNSRAGPIANILATPAVTWNAQTGPRIAAIAYIAPTANNPPPLSNGAIARTIADAWNDYTVTVITVPQTAQPSSGDSPPPYSIVVRTSIRAIWDAQASWGAQSEMDGAAVAASVPPVVNNPPGYSTVVQAIIRAVWDQQPNWPAQSESDGAAISYIAPAVNAPPGFSNVTQAIIRSIWDQQPAWGAQSEADGAAIGYIAPTVNSPPPQSIANQVTIRASWDIAPWNAQSETDNAGWNAAPAQIQPPTRSSWVNQRTILEQWVKPWHFSQGFTKIAAALPQLPGAEVPPRIVVTPNADRLVKPGADRILIVYAPRTVS